MIITKTLEEHFNKFKKHIVGNDISFRSAYGYQKVLYADWIASGRSYGPIEKFIFEKISPWVANTHSYSNETGTRMTDAYKEARSIIKSHVKANDNDMLILAGNGMTGALCRLQEILNLKIPSSVSKDAISLSEDDRPVVFITHMEHHSHHVSWMETISDVVIVPPGENFLVDPDQLETAIEPYVNRKMKIGAFTAGSNVSGIITPYHALAAVMHKYNGLCFVDFAGIAPYVNINMHPEDDLEHLDAIYFSPHKFLGGPGSCGVLVLNKGLYSGKSSIPGGGNVTWTSPWGNYAFNKDIETLEDGGTPGFIQAMRASLAIRLKEEMDPEKMQEREEELLKVAFNNLRDFCGINLVEDNGAKRVGVISFNIDGLHYNLVVRLLNDRFGIQVRGGWACASTYCHYLFGIDANSSKQIQNNINNRNMTGKPGWVRLSLHPTMTDAELHFVLDAIKKIYENQSEWSKGYQYVPNTNDFEQISGLESGNRKIIEQCPMT